MLFQKVLLLKLTFAICFAGYPVFAVFGEDAKPLLDGIDRTRQKRLANWEKYGRQFSDRNALSAEGWVKAKSIWEQRQKQEKTMAEPEKKTGP